MNDNIICGTYEYQIDPKGRMRIPAKLKAKLGENIYCMRADNGSITILPEAATARLYEKIAAVPLTDTEAQDAISEITSSMFELESDTQGRCLIPQSLREYAGLKDQIIIIGAGAKVSVWDAEKYNAWQKNRGAAVKTGSSVLTKYGI